MIAGPTKAMILAAGLGTRLRPLTDDRPKALVEVAGHTLLEITLARLRSVGIREVVVNAHHFADMVVDYLKAHDNFGMTIEVSREEVLLDTGGGLKKAAPFFLGGSLGSSRSEDEPFLLHNVDVVSTIDLERMVKFHKEHGALATLAVQDRETSRYLLFDERSQLCGRRSGRDGKVEFVQTNSVPASSPRTSQDRTVLERTDVASTDSAQSTHPPTALAFTGIHVISPRLLTGMTEKGVFSIINTYLRLAGEGKKILAFRADESYWRDLGKPGNITRAAEDLRENKFSFHF